MLQAKIVNDPEVRNGKCGEYMSHLSKALAYLYLFISQSFCHKLNQLTGSLSHFIGKKLRHLTALLERTLQDSLDD